MHAIGLAATISGGGTRTRAATRGLGRGLARGGDGLGEHGRGLTSRPSLRGEPSGVLGRPVYAQTASAACRAGTSSFGAGTACGGLRNLGFSRVGPRTIGPCGRSSIRGSEAQLADRCGGMRP